ncbi:MAG: hypothetical protein Q8P20_00015 [bacterium]|nr:hypothetical protein [bacterium]
MNNLFRNNSGSMVVEVLITLGMIGVIVFSIGDALAANNKLGNLSSKKEEAISYATQSLEIINAIKDQVFTCACFGNQKLEKISGNWKILDNYIDPPIISDTEFTRYIIFSSIDRNSQNKIVENGAGALDPNSKLVTVTVKWIENDKEKSVELQTLFTNWQNITP